MQLSTVSDCERGWAGGVHRVTSSEWRLTAQCDKVTGRHCPEVVKQPTWAAVAASC
jgi:hypothetical protein